MRKFEEIIEELELRDFPLVGGSFTWWGGPNIPDWIGFHLIMHGGFESSGGSINFANTNIESHSNPTRNWDDIPVQFPSYSRICG